MTQSFLSPGQESRVRRDMGPDCCRNFRGMATPVASSTACRFSLSLLGWRVDGGFGLRRTAGYLYVHDLRVQPSA